MIYPNFLKKGDTIGICAPSAGVGWKIEDFEKSLSNIRKNSYEIVETESVRVDAEVSAEASVRAAELNELLACESVKFIIIATGGDHLIEIFPYIDDDIIINNIKWIMGYSDPTSLLYYITTKHDIATFYGKNGGSFDFEDNSTELTFELIRGNLVEQHSFDTYYEHMNYFTGKLIHGDEVYWQLINSKELDVSGRLIGGCIDVLAIMIGTEIDFTNQFIDKYLDDGFIWYFDVYQMTPDELTDVLLKFKEYGYFNHAKAIVIGRIKFQTGEVSDYVNMIKNSFPDMPFIFNADIGHVFPTMTIINGSIGRLKCNDGRATLKMELK